MFSKIRSKIYNLLRSSEKYIKTDMVYLARGGFWLSMGTVISSLLSLGTAVAFANLIPKEVYGSYQYVLSVVALLGIFGLSGIKTSVAYSSARGIDGSLTDAVHAKMKWGAIGGVLSAGMGVYYILNLNLPLGYAFLVAGALLPFWEAPGLYVSYLQGKKRFDLMSMYENGAQAFATVAIIACIFFTSSLPVIIGTYLGSWFLARIFFHKKTLRAVPPNEVHDPETVRYGAHLTLMTALGSISSNIDKFLLWHLLGAAPVAVYTFAITIPVRVTGIANIINRMAFPKMTERALEEIKSSLIRKILFIVFLSLAVTLVYIFAVPYIFSIFFPQYGEAVPYAKVAAALIVLQPFSLIATTLSAHARKRPLYIYNTIIPILRSVLFVILIPIFHIMGAIYAVVINKIVESIVLMLLLKRAK